jgi:hypothetical protein
MKRTSLYTKAGYGLPEVPLLLHTSHQYLSSFPVESIALGKHGKTNLTSTSRKME